MQTSEHDQQPTQPDPPEIQPPESSKPDTVLGRVGPGPHDTELRAPAPPAATSHRKGKRPPLAAEAPTSPPAPPDADRLTLPRGGLVAMRQSGGLLFRSRELVVYRNGKLVYQQLAGYGGAQPTSQVKHVALSELVELHHLLKQIDFSSLPTVGGQNPDAFAYEIVARVGRKVQYVEVFEGSLPEPLGELIRELRRLMTDNQEDT